MIDLHQDDSGKTTGPSTLAVRIGRYVVLDSLGRGSMGEVERVRDRETGVEYALKRVFDGAGGSSDDEEDLKATYDLVHRLHHPHIAGYQFLERDPETGDFLLLMEYVRGEPLSRLLREKGPLPEQRALKLLAQVADALDYAHAQGVVHRDVKPSNLLVTAGDQAEGQVKLIDFGLATALRNSLPRAPGRDAITIGAGSRPYMAPELWAGYPATARTDQWALACTLYECLSGRTPWVSPDEGILRHGILELDPAPLAGVSEGTWARIRRALEKRPEKRCTCCREVIGGANGHREAVARADDGDEARRAGRMQLRAETSLRRKELAARTAELPKDLAREWLLAEEMWADPAATRYDEAFDTWARQVGARYDRIQDALELARIRPEVEALEREARDVSDALGAFASRLAACLARCEEPGTEAAALAVSLDWTRKEARELDAAWKKLDAGAGLDRLRKTRLPAMEAALGNVRGEEAREGLRAALARIAAGLDKTDRLEAEASFDLMRLGDVRARRGTAAYRALAERELVGLESWVQGLDAAWTAEVPRYLREIDQVVPPDRRLPEAIRKDLESGGIRASVEKARAAIDGFARKDINEGGGREVQALKARLAAIEARVDHPVPTRFEALYRWLEDAPLAALGRLVVNRRRQGRHASEETTPWLRMEEVESRLRTAGGGLDNPAGRAEARDALRAAADWLRACGQAAKDIEARQPAPGRPIATLEEGAAEVEARARMLGGDLGAQALERLAALAGEIRAFTEVDRQVPACFLDAHWIGPACRFLDRAAERVEAAGAVIDAATDGRERAESLADRFKGLLDQPQDAPFWTAKTDGKGSPLKKAARVIEERATPPFREGPYDTIEDGDPGAEFPPELGGLRRVLGDIEEALARRTGEAREQEDAAWMPAVQLARDVLARRKRLVQNVAREKERPDGPSRDEGRGHSARSSRQAEPEPEVSHATWQSMAASDGPSAEAARRAPWGTFIGAVVVVVALLGTWQWVRGDGTQDDAKAQARWEDYLARMQAAFAQAEETDKRSSERAPKIQAWDQFLVAFRADIPSSMVDDGLRNRAQARVDSLRAQAQKVATLQGQIENLGRSAVEALPSGQARSAFIGQPSRPAIAKALATKEDLLPLARPAARVKKVDGAWVVSGRKYGETQGINTNYTPALSMDGRHVSLVGLDHAVLILDTSTGRQVARLPEGGVGSATSMLFDGEGERFFVGSNHNVITVYSRRTWRKVNQLSTWISNEQCIREMQLSADGRLLLAVDEDTVAKPAIPQGQVFDLKNMRRIARFPKPGRLVGFVDRASRILFFKEQRYLYYSLSNRTVGFDPADSESEVRSRYGEELSGNIHFKDFNMSLDP